MLIDLHAHSSGISGCCRIPYDAVVRAARDRGLDGIVLTNHYFKAYVTDGDFSAFAKRYTEEFRLTKAYADTVGMKVFFGAEVTMEQYDRAHILLYGITEQWLEENPCLFDWTQEELYSKVKAVGGIVVQAHPYRGKKHLLDTRFLDGVEVNCHPLYQNSYFGDMLEIAKENGFLLTCGGDYHADTYRPKCGVYLPDELQSAADLAEYLRNTVSLKLCIQEPNTQDAYDYLYVRPLDADEN